MTKRFISVCLVMTALVASTNAFASRARQQVMGTADPFGALSGGTHGSFYYDDNYNIFFNPAYVNDFKNWVAIEKNNGSTGNAEGGFVYGMQNMSFGMYFNRGDAINVAPGGSEALTNVVTTGTNVTEGYTNARRVNARPIDLLFGYDMGAAKLGLGLTYGYFRAASTNTFEAPSSNNQLQDLNVRAGASVADFDPFVSFKVIGKDKTTPAGANPATVETKSKSFTIGTKYHYGEWSPFAYWRRDSVKRSTGGAAPASSELRAVTWGLGVGRNTKLGEGTNLNYAVGYHRLSGAAPSTTAGAVASAAGSSVIPIDMSLEHDIASWLVGRAGLGYRLWDQAQGVSQADNTTGRLGLTAKVGKANIDWAVGSTAGTENPDGVTFDFANGFFSTASLTYAW